MKKNQMKVKRNLLLCSWLSFFLLISVLPGNASVFAQQEKLALSSTQLTVREIFDAISSQLRYDVFYNGEQLDLNRKVKFAQQVLNLEQVLDAVANNRFKYTLEDRTIILTPLTTPQTVNSVTLTGQVTDQSNTPLPGVTVLVKGTKLGTSTDPEGNFKLSLPQQENTILIFCFHLHRIRTQNGRYSKHFAKSENPRPFFCHSGQHLIRLRSEPPAEYGNPWEIEYAGYA